MDDIIESVSPFGKYQKCVLVLIGTTSILSAMTIYSTIFTTASPDIKCFFKQNQSDSLLKNPCDLLDEYSIFTNNSEYVCNYDDKYFGKTIITEWNLICSKQFYGSLTQTLYMVGTFSSLIIGYFSDRFGRKKLSLVLTILIFITCLISQSLQIDYFNFSFNLKYSIYSVSQFLIGMLCNSLYVVTYVLIIELTTSKYKTKATNFNLYFYILGELIILLVAYVTKNWHYINWFICVYSLLTIILIYLFLPESPRFLVQKNRVHEANQILSKMAKFNGKEIKMNENELIQDLILHKQDSVHSKLDTENIDKSDKILMVILKSKSIIFRSLMTGYVWFSISMVYYGIGLGVTNVKNVNPYVMYLLSSMAEIIGCFISYLNDVFKRKVMFIIFLGFAGITCLLVAFIPQKEIKKENEINLEEILIISLTIMGKAMVSAASICSYIYTSSLFPTKIRNTLFLFVSSIGKTGSIISPFINLLGILFWRPFTFIVFGFSSLIGCLFIIILPNPDNLDL